MRFRYGPKLDAENKESAYLLTGLQNLGVRAVFSASSQRQGAPMKPQTGLPHLLRAGVEVGYAK